MKYKYVIVFALAGLLFTGCDEAAGVRVTATNGEETTIQWLDSVKNYGKINEDQVLQVAFRFKNTGNKPLVIESVVPGCGCTAANPPEKPILPGEEGVINASFDSKGRAGANKKDITVTANTVGNKQHTLHFDVEVIGKKN